MKRPEKILQIGNYPPPMCGWAIQTKLVTEELRRRGHTCQVLKINENRAVKDLAYIEVRGGFDYTFKVLRYAFAGCRLNVHLNGQSRTGYILALIAALAGRLGFRPALVTFHGGLSQVYFPRPDCMRYRLAFRWLFQLAGGIACDSDAIRQEIITYGICPEKVTAIQTFSAQYLDFKKAPLSQQVNDFLVGHSPVFFCYVSFRPEYRLEMLREAMSRFRQHQPQAGFIWLGFPGKELPAASHFVQSWSAAERQSLQLLGNLTHDEFLTLLSRCYACIRTPVCDGVAASVLESLALGVPVVASENARRPEGTVTYEECDAADLAAKLVFLTEHYSTVKARLSQPEMSDNIGRMADWLAGDLTSATREEAAHAT